MIELELRKGKPEDICIEVDESFFDVVAFGDDFRQKCKDFSLQIKKDSKRICPTLITLHVRNKEAEPKPTSKGSKAIKTAVDYEELLRKYTSAREGQANQSALASSVDLKDFSAKLHLIYCDTAAFSSSFSDIEKAIAALSKDADVKKILLCEGLMEHFSSSEIRNSIIESSQQQSQGTIFTSKGKRGSSISSILDWKRINSEATFLDWLTRVNIFHSFDHIMSKTKRESLDNFFSLVVATIEAKYKKPLGPFDTKRVEKNSEFACYAGIDDMYSQAWLQMISSLPGISESKALSVVRKYPTIDFFMNELIKIESAKEREALLRDLPVIYDFNQSKSRNLGKAASKKIVRVFTSRDPNETI
eukprot:TRINITY_DN6667_c0_g1_i5.p1 TRINITY_DN6667_c0_g1~~TRINITY_DN6667_c0_g1_i5.p1  ORF type:complete len:361 (+),score=74.14 TRINITY_DN6667_c0_g1_i5:1002-2084(+)